jgi:hypothetical protein
VPRSIPIASSLIGGGTYHSPGRATLGPPCRPERGIETVAERVVVVRAWSRGVRGGVPGEKGTARGGAACGSAIPTPKMELDARFYGGAAPPEVLRRWSTCSLQSPPTRSTCRRSSMPSRASSSLLTPSPAGRPGAWGTTPTTRPSPSGSRASWWRRAPSSIWPRPSAAASCWRSSSGGRTRAARPRRTGSAGGCSAPSGTSATSARSAPRSSRPPPSSSARSWVTRAPASWLSRCSYASSTPRTC